MKMLVVAAHPDDEVLGCGGTIAKHIKAGDEVQVLILAQGREDLRMSARKALNKLGVSLKNMHFANLEDQSLDIYAFSDIVGIIERYSADIVYTHDENDLNLDHQITAQAVKTAFRPIPGQQVKTILAFEVLSSSEWGKGFTPDYFVDISKTYKHKIAALECYASEMRHHPHPRSFSGVDALIRLRGMSVGVSAAEAFKVVRMVC